MMRTEWEMCLTFIFFKQDIIYAYFGLKYNREMFLTGTRVQVTRSLSTANYFYLWCHVVMLSEPSHAFNSTGEGVLWEEHPDSCLHPFQMENMLHWQGTRKTLISTTKNVDMPVWQTPYRGHFVVMWQDNHKLLYLRSNEVTLRLYIKNIY